jgi:hypothetical protein
LVIDVVDFNPLKVLNWFPKLKIFWIVCQLLRKWEDQVSGGPKSIQKSFKIF